MLELAPRPVDRAHEVTLEPGEASSRLPERLVSASRPVERAPVQDARDAHLAALAAAADPSYVRVFRPAPPLTGDELWTGFNEAFWSLMAVLVGILGLTIVGGTLVVCALTVWHGR